MSLSTEQHVWHFEDRSCSPCLQCTGPATRRSLQFQFRRRFVIPPAASLLELLYVASDSLCMCRRPALLVVPTKGRFLFTGSPLALRLPFARCLLSVIEFSADIPALLAKLAILRAGYGSGIYNSASYYQSHGLSQQSYRSDLSNALHSSSASAAAASSGKL